MAGITYPFFPRHLTIISTLTIGVPASAGYDAASAGYDAASRATALLGVFAMGLWVLGLVAGRPALRRVVLIAAMGACVVPLRTVPAAQVT